MVSVKRLCY